MKVHRRVLIPSPLLRSLTSLITLNKRKKVIEMRALSSVFWGQERKKWGEEEKPGRCSFQANAGMKLNLSFMPSVTHAFISTEMRCKKGPVQLWISLPIADVCTVLQRRTVTHMRTMPQRDLQNLHTEYVYILDTWFLKSSTVRAKPTTRPLQIYLCKMIQTSTWFLVLPCRFFWTKQEDYLFCSRVEIVACFSAPSHAHRQAKTFE